MIRVALLIRPSVARHALLFCLEQQTDLTAIDVGIDKYFLDCEVVLVHHHLPQRARDCLARVASKYYGAKFIIIGAPHDPTVLADYLQQGYHGYVLRGEPYDVLLDVVRMSAAGNVRLESAVLHVMLERIRDRAEVEPLVQDVH